MSEDLPGSQTGKLKAVVRKELERENSKVERSSPINGVIKLWPIILSIGMAIATGAVWLWQVRTLASDVAVIKVNEADRDTRTSILEEKHARLRAEFDANREERKQDLKDVASKLDSITSDLQELKGMLRGRRQER